MRDGFYRQTRRVEERHWWFVHRRRLVRAWIEPSRSGAAALDLGCGSGGNLALLEQAGFRTVGLDRSAIALGLAREARPGARLVLADANRLEACFAPRSFDLVTVFNVLYHRWVEDEGAVLAQIREVLRPGGRLVLTEPALAWLRRRHDRVDFGRRRYTRGQLVRIVEQAGLEVVRATYFNAPALGPAALAALLDRLAAPAHAGAGEAGESTAEIAVPPPWLDSLLVALCGAERWWIARMGDLPAGVGLAVVARRR